MYKTGDLPKNIEKLKIELKQLKYTEKLDIDAIYEGNPLVFLPILHFSLLSYSKLVAQTLVDNEYELYSKSDKEFINKIFKCMIDLFSYKPSLNPRQFFMSGYSEAKVIFCLEVIRLVKQEHNVLLKKSYSSNNSKKVNEGISIKSYKYKEKEKEDFINYASTSNKNVKIINHMKTDKNNNSYIDESSSPVHNSSSPKFNSEQENKKYNFNKDLNLIKDFSRSENNNAIYKNYNSNGENENQIYELNDIENIEINDENNNEDISSEVYKFNNQKIEKKSNGNFNRMGQVAIRMDNVNNQGKISKISISQQNINTTSNSNNNNNNFNLSSVIEIINTFSNSIKDMTTKVDSFKNSIESRVSNIEAEITIIKNRMTFLESINTGNNSNRQAKPDNVTTISDSVQESTSNEHLFSFADDNRPHYNGNLNQSDKKCRENNKKKLNNTFTGTNENTLIQNKTQSHKLSNNNFMNKIPTKLLNDIEDTDSIIQRVANRFKETQKLLNEFK